MHVVCRSSVGVRTGSHIVLTSYNNPTGMAVAALCTFLKSGFASDSILEAGGAPLVPALVQLLKESTCPQTVTITAIVVEALLDPRDKRPGGVADRFFESGKWKPVAFLGIHLTYRAFFYGNAVRLCRVPWQFHKCMKLQSLRQTTMYPFNVPCDLLPPHLLYSTRSTSLSLSPSGFSLPLSHSSYLFRVPIADYAAL